MDCIILRYAELSLKGHNRIGFEKKLVKNIKACLNLNKKPYEKIERLRNRIVIHTEKACPELKNVFGICSYSNALMAKKSLDDIKKSVLNITQDFTPKTKFRISTKRLDKNFCLDSIQIDKEIGSLVVGKTRAKVSLREFDVEIGVEILTDSAYVFREKVCCFGGLPLGISGCAICLIEDKKAILASWLMMKRGLLVLPVAMKNIQISLLKKYSYGYDLDLAIVKGYKELSDYITRKNAKALILGQTLEDFREIPTNVLVLRPLIAYDNQQIEALYKKIK